MPVARRAVALNVCLAVLIFSASCSRPQTPEYAGSWLLKYRGQNLMLLTVSGEGTKARATLVSPQHFSVDQEGYFHQIQPPLAERSLVGTAKSSAEVVLAESGTDNELTMRVTGSGRAEVRMQGSPAYFAPWVFERVAGDAPLMATTWQPAELKSPEHESAARRLLEMAEEDQSIRQGHIDWNALDRLAAKHKPEILKIHARFGWPKRSELGMDAADAFWLLVQHQDHALQKRLLPEMEMLVVEGEASRQNFTLLFDRVRKGDGLPQRYGNSTSCVEGRAVLDPVEDRQGLDQRRAELFLPPIAEYLQQIDPMCANAPFNH